VNPLIRPATAEDAEGLGRMHHAAWVETYTPLLPTDFWAGFPVEARVEGWRRHLGGPVSADVRVLVAESAGRIVGHAIAGPGRAGEDGAYPAVRDREVYSLYVLAAHHGSGLGQALLDAVLGPDEQAQLWVFEHNPRARAFYRRNRFVPDGARHVFGEELGRQPEIRLVR
jgi:GNAT superfamily N-acetyltransferase